MNINLDIETTPKAAKPRLKPKKITKPVIIIDSPSPKKAKGAKSVTVAGACDDDRSKRCGCHLLPTLMLTLDCTTLFYFSLYSLTNKDKDSGAIDDWADRVSQATQPTRNHKTTSIRSGSTPSLTTGLSHSTRPLVSARLALTNNIKITEDNSIIIRSDGGLSDHDETRGPEREAAIKSPPKGKQRLTSTVSIS